MEHRWVGLPQALELLPWPAQRQAVGAIAELVGNGGSSECTLLPPSAFTTTAPPESAMSEPTPRPMA